MNTRSLTFRLAVLYFCSMAAISAVAAGGYWLAVRWALHSALDQGLRYRLVGLHQYLQYVDPDDPEELVEELEAVLQMGELYQVFDGRGRLLTQSAGLDNRGTLDPPPRDLGPEIRYGSGGPDDFPLRLAWQRVMVEGEPLILVAVDPQRKYAGVIGAFTTVLLLSMPVILLLASACGIWLGRRALAPVARIAEDARAITEQNLSARLAVPSSGDEIQQLSETLNAMLARIEGSFVRVRQFTADASHELRAPLTLIHTAAESSLRRERSREALEENLRKILRETQRTSALIDDLLLLARGDAQQVDELRPLDASALVREVAEQATTMAARKDIVVQVQLPEGTLPVWANRERLRRLFLILIDNAVKFTSDGGTVTVAGSRDAARIQISVADTGPGISLADQPHIFERFWRADKARTRDAGGAGLGLAIARQIANQHRATIDVRSDPGHGAQFVVSLPLGGA